MFKSIKLISSTPSDRVGMIYEYVLEDNEIGYIFTSLTNNSSSFIRIIISEYSRRNLNVIENLKLYLIWVFCNKESGNSIIHYDYNYVISGLNNWNYYLNTCYPELHFENYHKCLINYIDKLKFVGKIT